MADDGEIDLDAIEKRMDGALASLRNEFMTLRTGRASASMLDPVMVEAYGTPTPVNQVAMDQLKKAKDAMSEDDEKIWSDEVQELTDQAIKNIDEVLEGKQAEIMQV